MQEYIIYAVGALLLIAAGYVAFAQGYQDRVYRIIYRLVCNAEAEIVGTKRGAERKSRVVDALYDLLPAWARLFVSEEDIDDLIELAVEKMKQLLAAAAGIDEGGKEVTA